MGWFIYYVYITGFLVFFPASTVNPPSPAWSASILQLVPGLEVACAAQYGSDTFWQIARQGVSCEKRRYRYGSKLGTPRNWMGNAEKTKICGLSGLTF